MSGMAICRYPLALGWYVVRNPNQAALVRGTSSNMARQQEEAFFTGTTPWNRLPVSSKGRLGGWLTVGCPWYVTITRISLQILAIRCQVMCTIMSTTVSWHVPTTASYLPQ